MSDLIKRADTLTIPLPEELLPPRLAELVELIGLPAVTSLIRHYPGIKLYVPMKYDPSHVLTRQIGHAETVKLIEIYGGDFIDVAKADKAIRAVRNSAIGASDKTQRQLALEHGLTIRQIRNIQRTIEVDDGQAELF